MISNNLENYKNLEPDFMMFDVLHELIKIFKNAYFSLVPHQKLLAANSAHIYCLNFGAFS